MEEEGWGSDQEGPRDADFAMFGQDEEGLLHQSDQEPGDREGQAAGVSVEPPSPVLPSPTAAIESLALLSQLDSPTPPADSGRGLLAEASASSELAHGWASDATALASVAAATDHSTAKLKKPGNEAELKRALPRTRPGVQKAGAVSASAATRRARALPGAPEAGEGGPKPKAHRSRSVDRAAIREEGVEGEELKKVKKVKKASGKKRAIKEVQSKLANNKASDALAKWLENKKLQKERVMQRRLYGRAAVNPKVLDVPEESSEQARSRKTEALRNVQGVLGIAPTPMIGSKPSIHTLRQSAAKENEEKLSPSPPAKPKVRKGLPSGRRSLETKPGVSQQSHHLHAAVASPPDELATELPPVGGRYKPCLSPLGIPNDDASTSSSIFAYKQPNLSPNYSYRNPYSRGSDSSISPGNPYAIAGLDGYVPRDSFEVQSHRIHMSGLQPIDISDQRLMQMPGVSPRSDHELYSPTRSNFSASSPVRQYYQLRGSYSSKASSPGGYNDPVVASEWTAALTGQAPLPQPLKPAPPPRPMAQRIATEIRMSESPATAQARLQPFPQSPSSRGGFWGQSQSASRAGSAATQAAAEAEAEREVLYWITQREELLQEFGRMAVQEDAQAHAGYSSPNVPLARLWHTLQEVTVSVVEAVVSWQTRRSASGQPGVAQRAFMWNGSDYLCKLGPDLAFLDNLKFALARLGGSSPALDPFAPLQPPVGNLVPLAMADPLRVRMATTVLRRARDQTAVRDLVRASLVSPGAGHLMTPGDGMAAPSFARAPLPAIAASLDDATEAMVGRQASITRSPMGTLGRGFGSSWGSGVMGEEVAHSNPLGPYPGDNERVLGSEEGSPTIPPVVSQPTPLEEAAATHIQEHVRGHLVRASRQSAEPGAEAAPSTRSYDEAGCMRLEEEATNPLQRSQLDVEDDSLELGSPPVSPTPPSSRTPAVGGDESGVPPAAGLAAPDNPRLSSADMVGARSLLPEGEEEEPVPEPVERVALGVLPPDLGSVLEVPPDTTNRDMPSGTSEAGGEAGEPRVGAEEMVRASPSLEEESVWEPMELAVVSPEAAAGPAVDKQGKGLVDTAGNDSALGSPRAGVALPVDAVPAPPESPDRTVQEALAEGTTGTSAPPDGAEDACRRLPPSADGQENALPPPERTLEPAADIADLPDGGSEAEEALEPTAAAEGTAVAEGADWERESILPQEPPPPPSAAAAAPAEQLSPALPAAHPPRLPTAEREMVASLESLFEVFDTVDDVLDQLMMEVDGPHAAATATADNDFLHSLGSRSGTTSPSGARSLVSDRATLALYSTELQLPLTPEMFHRVAPEEEDRVELMTSDRTQETPSTRRTEQSDGKGPDSWRVDGQGESSEREERGDEWARPLLEPETATLLYDAAGLMVDSCLDHLLDLVEEQALEEEE